MLLGGAFRRAARCVARRRARRESFFVLGRAVLKSKRVCVREAARPASRCGLDEKRVLRSSIRG